MKLPKIRIRTGVKLVALMMVVVTAVGLVEKKQQSKTCNRVVVNIDNQFDNYFINENDILKLVSEGGMNYILGKKIDEFDLKNIEYRIKSNKFVHDVEVFTDLEGNLVVHAKQSKPIARVVQTYGPDAYIDTDGRILPVSDRFTARVLLISGDFTRTLVKSDLEKTPEGKQIFEMLQYIQRSELWQAQIVQLDIDARGEIVLYSQVSDQLIEFGKAEDIARKFKKLEIFYKEILPKKGWNKYERVNLKYENQIVCE